MNYILNHKCICKQCEINTDKKNLVARGSKTEYRLINEGRKSFDKYVVDDCLLKLKEREEKCDYLFMIIDMKEAFFIECKGSDILKAIRQLDSSINILGRELAGFVFKGRIIPTKVYSPDLRTLEHKRLRAKLKGELEIKNKVFEEII